MAYFPDLDTFRHQAKQGNLIPVFRELPADLETPVSVFLKLGQRPPTFLLESVEGGETLGRFSFLGANPHLVVETRGSQATVRRNGSCSRLSLEGRDPLHLVQELLSGNQIVTQPGLPRFFGGAVGYLAYDMVRFFEKLPQTAKDELGLPDCLFIFTDTMVVFDHVQHRIKVMSNARVDGDAEAAYRQAIASIDQVVAAMSRPLPPPQRKPLPASTGPLVSNFTQEEFEARVRQAKEYIAAGDAFQIVLSQRLRRRTLATPFAIYRALRMLNPSPYMFFLDLGDFQFIGSSPEMLVKAEDGQAEARPIAGTRPRGRTEAEDQALVQDLLADPKERAEHVMLVDLARNDLGRVCRYGTMTVPLLMGIEKYSHVSHIVSSVHGKLEVGQDAFSLLRAAFPAGTVSGAPKIRAMEIIEELEGLRRGPYAGAVGYFGYGGNMDTCITIRTIIMVGDTVYLQAGAGIVADSDPEREYHETLNKLKALERAVAIAEEPG